MKRQIFALLIIAFGLATISKPSFAMKRSITTMLSEHDVFQIPLGRVSNSALYLLTKMASGTERGTLLDYIRYLSDDEVEKLKQDSQYLDSQDLQMLIKNALYTTLVSRSGDSFDVSLSDLDVLMELAPNIAKIISSAVESEISTMEFNLGSSTLYLLTQMASAYHPNSLIDYMNGLNTGELERLIGDAHFLESNELLDLILKLPTSIAAVKLQSLFRGTSVRKETVMPGELADYLAKNYNLLDFADSCGNRVDVAQLSKILAREILAKKNLPAKGKRLFKQEEDYFFYVHDDRGNFSHREVIKLPVGLWAKPVGGGIELELIGKPLGGGSLKSVLQSRPISIDLQTQTHDKKVEEAVVVQLYTLSEVVLKGMKALRDAFTPEERLDPDLRIAGNLSLLDRINPRTGQIEARDVEYAGDLEQLSKQLEISSQIQVFADVATTLMKFHVKGLTHGDIKKQNILVSKGTPRGFVCDFDSLQASGIDKTQIHTLMYKDEILDNLGLETPFHDIVALALTATNTLTPCELFDRIHQAADDVFSADKQTVAFIKSRPDILEQLLSNDKIKVQAAMAAIHSMFPMFQNFMIVLQKEAARLQVG